MTAGEIQYTVFSKPWKTMGLPELGRFLRELGFDGVELPVRPEFQVEPDNVEKGLPEAARVLADNGVKIGSVAGPTDERTIAACAEADVPMIRICANIPRDKDYATAIADMQRAWDALVPALDEHGVAIGVQNHAGRCIANAMETVQAIAKYDPKHVCLVWDAAHEALAGAEPELALDVGWPHLGLVNLKNAFWKRTNGPEADVARWTWYWTSGRQGRAEWDRVVAALKERGYRGDICLTAEYSDQDAVDRLIAEDLAYAKSLFARGTS
jgi:sugar phosphate isomerase/epimerase